MRLFPFCAWLSLSLTAVSAWGQQDEKLRIGPIYPGRYPDMEIVLETTPPPNQTETVFRSNDLTLVEDGSTGKVASGLRQFRDIGAGMAVVVAIDASGSMRGRPLAAVRGGLAQFVSDARSYDKIALLTFADDGRWEATWTTPREQLQQKLEAIDARGTRTRLWDAVNAAVSRLEERSERRRLVVISDGHDEGSTQSVQAVANRASMLHIPVDCIGLTRSSAVYLQSLRSLSAATGGIYRLAPDENTLRQLIGGGVRRLLDGPVARFRYSRIKQDGKMHWVSVRWRGGAPGSQLWFQIDRRNPAWLPVWVEPWHVAVLLLLIVGAIVLTRRRKPSPLPMSPQIPEYKIPQNPLPLDPPQAVKVETPPVARPAKDPVKVQRARTQFAPIFTEPTAAHPAGILKAQEGPIAGRAVPIDRGEFWIGAAEGNHLRIADDPSVSGHHACVRFEGSALKIYDNQSTNNTWVNREAVGDTARLLYPGDRIQVGRSIFVLEENR